MKKYERFFILTVAIGFIILLGTVGDADLDLIGLRDLFSRSLIALWILLSGAVGLNLCKE